MEPINFPQSNKNLLKPDGMTDQECGSLPIYTDGEACVSLWKMTWRERLSALFFGRIWLFVISGITQPPVLLMGRKDIFSKEPDSDDGGEYAE